MENTNNYTVRDFTFKSSDGVHDIHVRSFLPEGKPAATFQIAHGIAEHIRRYDDFAAFLASNNIAVFGNDHLGHGESFEKPEDRGFFAESDGWDIVCRDLHELHGIIAKEYPDTKHVLFGHSMGSFLARTYAIKYPGDHDGYIFCGTGNNPRLVLMGGRMLANREIKKNGARYVSESLYKLAMGSYDKYYDDTELGLPTWLSADSENRKKYEADPLCGFIPSCSLLRDMMDGLLIISDKKNLAKMKKDTPVFLIAGSGDPVGNMGKAIPQVAAMLKAAGVVNVSEKLYQGSRHEILNEKDNFTVYNDVLDWMRKEVIHG